MLDRLSPNTGSRRSRKRVGRGIGSGSGKTCGRGTKGAGARSGSRRRAYFEGGQMPLSRRVPKRGFTNIFRESYQVVNVKALGRFDAGTEVDAELLAGAGLIHSAHKPVKVLAEGDLASALKLKVNAISASARAKVEAAGGSIELIERKPGKADLS
jgi:large subunit ribosomal protein L15